MYLPLVLVRLMRLVFSMLFLFFFVSVRLLLFFLLSVLLFQMWVVVCSMIASKCCSIAPQSNFKRSTYATQCYHSSRRDVSLRMLKAVFVVGLMRGEEGKKKGKFLWEVED